MAIIFLDNASTTPVERRVLRKMNKVYRRVYGNPSSIHMLGTKAKKVVEDSRKVCAEYLNCRPVNIVFTSGGTESNNLAILGVFNALTKEGRTPESMHFITTNIEHGSVLEVFRELESRGAKVDYIKVNDDGVVEPKRLREFLNENTVLVSIGYSNSEIGAVQDIREIAKEVRHFRKERKSDLPILHTDASQAVLCADTNTEKLGADMMTVDAQKIYGPKGAGLLFKKDNVKIFPIMYGGGQESGLRSGTENTALIVGLAEALVILEKRKETDCKNWQKLQKYFFENISKFVKEYCVNGTIECRMPNNVNISIKGKDSDFVVFQLEQRGLIVSSQSACSSTEIGSRVVRALGDAPLMTAEERSKSSLRITFGRSTRGRHISKLLRELGKIF